MRCNSVQKYRLRTATKRIFYQLLWKQLWSSSILIFSILCSAVVPNLYLHSFSKRRKVKKKRTSKLITRIDWVRFNIVMKFSEVSLYYQEILNCAGNISKHRYVSEVKGNIRDIFMGFVYKHTSLQVSPPRDVFFSFTKL